MLRACAVSLVKVFSLKWTIFPGNLIRKNVTLNQKNFSSTLSKSPFSRYDSSGARGPRVPNLKNPRHARPAGEVVK